MSAVRQTALFAIAFLSTCSLFGAEDPASLRGVVTMMRDGEHYFFMRADDGLDWRISLRGDAHVRFARGDTVQVDGLLEPRRNRNTTRIFEAVATKTGHDESAVPDYRPASMDELWQGRDRTPLPTWYASPVRVSGVVHDFWRTDNSLNMVLLDLDDYVQCKTTVPISIPLPRHFDRGARVEVRGIAVYSALWGEGHVLVGFENVNILTQGMEAITVLSQPPFWTTARLWALVGSTALALALLALWTGLLRRTVAKRSAQLFAAMKAKNEAEAVQNERRRMAADLHDTIEQNIAGVKMLLTCALKAEKDDERDKARDMIARAAEMLIHAKGEVRQVVMNLRNDAILDQSPAEALRDMARQIESKGTIRARVCLNGLPAHLEATRHADLMMIVREAITNAVKHGKAKNIALVADNGERGTENGFVLRVLNDGEPFDAEAALGPETGHFGLAGMQERAFRSRFKLSFGQEGKWVSARIEVLQ